MSTRVTKKCQALLESITNSHGKWTCHVNNFFPSEVNNTETEIVSYKNSGPIYYTVRKNDSYANQVGYLYEQIGSTSGPSGTVILKPNYLLPMESQVDVQVCGKL